MANQIMSIVTGEPCDNPLDGSVERAILDWYDGPLLTLHGVGPSLYLVAWADLDDTTHRWLVMRVSRERFDAFGDGASTFSVLFSQPEDGHLYVLDGHGGKTSRCVRVQASDLPADLLPGDVPFPRSEWREQPKLDGDES